MTEEFEYTRELIKLHPNYRILYEGERNRRINLEAFIMAELLALAKWVEEGPFYHPQTELILDTINSYIDKKEHGTIDN